MLPPLIFLINISNQKSECTKRNEVMNCLSIWVPRLFSAYHFQYLYYFHIMTSDSLGNLSIISIRTDEKAKNAIQDAIDDFERLICFKFVKRKNEINYLFFQNDGQGGCWSYVGRLKNKKNPVCVMQSVSSVSCKELSLNDYRCKSEMDAVGKVPSFTRSCMPSDFSTNSKGLIEMIT